MTQEEIALAKDLGGCRFVPGSWEKRFSRQMSTAAHETPAVVLTAKQARWLRILHHKFRRQIQSHVCGQFCRVEELPGSLK